MSAPPARSDFGAYCARRAASYERVCFKPERQAELRTIETWLPGVFAGFWWSHVERAHRCRRRQLAAAHAGRRLGARGAEELPEARGSARGAWHARTRRRLDRAPALLGAELPRGLMQS
jgi:hypothetical protein